MEKIVTLVRKIGDEVRSADEYADLAANYKVTDRMEADTFHTIAMQKLGIADILHAQVVRIIKEEHAKGTKIPEGMEKAYDEIHKDKMKDVLRIRMQLDEYKK